MGAPFRRCAAVIGLILALPASAGAQALIAILLGDKLSTENFQLGLNVSAAGVGFSGTSNRLQLSWGIGMYGEIRLSRAIRLVPELMLKSPAGAARLSPRVLGYPFTPPGEPTLDALVTEGEVTRTLHYVALPVTVKWVYGPIGIGLGPQFSVLGRARDTVSSDSVQGQLQLSTSIRAALRPVDAGLVASVEYAFQSQKGMRSLRVRAKGYYGLVDTVEENPGTPVRNWYLMLGVDIPIGGTSQSTPAQRPPHAPSAEAAVTTPQLDS